MTPSLLTLTRWPFLLAVAAATFPPARGPFTFPAPYGGAAVRLTDAADCGGADCIDEAAVGVDARLVRVVIGRRGGSPELVVYEADARRVQRRGALFEPGSRYAAS